MPAQLCKALARHFQRKDFEWCDALFDYHCNCRDSLAESPETHDSSYEHEIFVNQGVKSTIDKKLRRLRSKQTVKHVHPPEKEQTPIEVPDAEDASDEFPEFESVEQEKIISTLMRIHKNLGH